MARTTNYPLKCFRRFVSAYENLTSDSLDSYCTYLRNILGINGCKEYLDKVYAAYSNSHPALMVGIVNDVIKVLDQTSGYSKEKSAIQFYKRYIEYVANNHINIVQDYMTTIQNPSCPAIIKNKLSGTLDSMKVLESALGGVDKFIKLAIESSYFFDKDSVQTRFNVVCASTKLPARICTKEDTDNRQSPLSGKSLIKGQNATFKDGTYYMPIILDKDNNCEVHKLINDVTGYTVGAGKECIFQNYNISHIWGKASDPRYFTNLWNIVLVPAWANHLLDKNPKPGSTAAKFKATMMAICEQQYGMGELSWDDLKMSQNPQISNKDDVIQGDYTINVISGKGSKKLGCITKQTIHV